MAAEAAGTLLQDKRKQRCHTVVIFPQRSINIHFTTLIPDLINDVKAMTQQSLGAATVAACQFLFPVRRGDRFARLSRGTNLNTERDRIEIVTFLRPSIAELSTACHYKEQICKSSVEETV